MTTKILHAVIRIEKLTGKPAIFYRNPAKYRGNALSVYTREEQHSEGGVSYYREKTRPASSEEERAACAALIAHYTQYCAKYGDEALMIHARLRNN
jgi:hypothetical protein